MKKCYIFAALMLISLVAGGRDKLNPSGRLLYNAYKDRIVTLSTSGNNSQAPERQGMLIEVTNGADLQSIIELGFDINNIMGTIISGSIDMANIEALENLDQVLNISFGEVYCTQLDFARPVSKVDQVQDGFEYNGTQFSFDGTGVIAGMMDTGFEANHVNFQNADGSSRIAQLWHFRGTNGNTSVKKYDPDNMFRFTTDTSGESHATHVAGIMSGSYKGNATFYKTSNPMFGNSTKNENAPCPYYGVATGSTLAFAVGSLSNSNIADGVADIAEYAKTENMPAVINLSIGSTSGPHDGSDLLSKAFAYYGKDAIICVASGNDGDASIYAGKTFTDDDTEMKLQFANNRASGTVDVWGSDATIFNFQWAAYNPGTRTFEVISDINPGSEIRINSSNAVFSKYFTGSIKTTAGVSSLNNRYQVYSECSSVAPRTSASSIVLAIVISGVPRQSIYAYGSTGISGSTEFASDLYLPGWTDGTKSNSINNLACGQNIISVGSYNTRAYWTTLAGNTYTLQGGVSVNDISDFSSYGTNFQGDELPLVAAPGCCIVSSVNKYNLSQADDVCAQALNPIDGATDYWGEMQGTSMACPLVSGVIALWLEANPNLDCADVVEVIKSTSITDRYTRRTPERFGAGKIDALAGIKKVLDDKASVGAIFADDERNFILTPVDGGYNVYVAGESELDVTLYDASGRTVASVSAGGNTVDVDTSSLRPGVYILSAQGNTQRHTAKIAVK